MDPFIQRVDFMFNHWMPVNDGNSYYSIQCIRWDISQKHQHENTMCSMLLHDEWKLGNNVVF